MLKILLWVGAIVFGYLAWTAGEMRETTGDLAYLKQAIGWGIASLACVVISVTARTSARPARRHHARARH